MYIIEVIPISRSIGSDSLSYFTTKLVSLGDIVDIPLRNKNVFGIVISVKKAEDIKGDIKKAGFQLKKIEKIKGTTFFNKAFIEMIYDIADYYASSTGSILNILVPEYIFNNIQKLKIDNKNTEATSINKGIKTIKEKYAVQGDTEERYSTWKGLIRQEFAKKKSLLFIVPTIEESDHSFELLEKGIEGYIYKLNGSLTPKKIIETWNQIIKEDHPVVIICTGGFLSIPRNDIETIIVENESSKSYKIQRRPFLDIRQVCEVLADKKSIRIFFADDVLRIETLWRESEGMIIQSSPFKSRSLSTSKDTLIDMKRYKNTNSSFKIISDEVDELIKKTKDDSEQMMILTTRKGLSPTTICGDCQSIVLCNNCSAPIVLHANGDKKFFMCHRCGERRSAEEYCKNCNSWRLESIGIGIDLVIEKIKEKYPDITIFKIDSESTAKEKNVKNVISKFKSKPGSILIGTEMMLSYIHGKVENSAIISLDSLFSLPDFRIQEKILNILIRIRTLTTKHFIIQTRKSDEKVFEYGIKGNTNDFFRNEIEERKRFNYPPFFTLIKITLEGKKDKIIKEMEEAQNILDPYEVEVFPAFTHTIRGNYVLHGLIRLEYSKWPNQDLNSKLRSLSPNIKIKVDPETLL